MTGSENEDIEQEVYIRTWKNTGFCFELKCDDATALTNAVKAVKEYSYWKMNGEAVILYLLSKASDLKYLLSVDESPG